MPNRNHPLLVLICIAALVSGCWPDPNPLPVSIGQFNPTEITLKEVPNQELKELVDKRLTFVDSKGEKWTAPKGTWTDGASVPRFAVWITDGRFQKEFLKAAVVHDAYCQEENKERCPKQYQKKPWEAVHRMFYEACIAGGTSETKAKMMFAAVWLAGPTWNDPDRNRQQVSDELLRTGIGASKKWIEEINPTVDEIEAHTDKRRTVLFEIHELETKSLDALRAGDTAKAKDKLKHADAIVKQGLDKSPNDLMLLNLQGKLDKNWAKLYLRENKENKANDALADAEKSFEKVIEMEPTDPSAQIGMSSVLILRDDPAGAETFVRKALSIDPKFREAKKELRRIERLKRERPPD